MAKRPYYVAKGSFPFFEERFAEFKFEPGFALVQARKNIHNFHDSIEEIEKTNCILEVSTKSNEDLGVALSAFSLQYPNTSFKLENVFQSSKVFENGGPFRELLNMLPGDAKRSEQLKTSGRLVSFRDLENNSWNLEPKTAYYDWIYINAAMHFLDKKTKCKEMLLRYSVFTDIAYNPQKSINCQARSLAMLVGLLCSRMEKRYLADQTSFLALYAIKENTHEIPSKQISMFDLF